MAMELQRSRISRPLGSSARRYSTSHEECCLHPTMGTRECVIMSLLHFQPLHLVGMSYVKENSLQMSVLFLMFLGFDKNIPVVRYHPIIMTIG